MELNIMFIIKEFFTDIRLVDVIDLLLVIYLLYELYQVIRGTAAINIFFGIISIYLIWKLVILLDMKMLSEIIGQFISVGVIALIIVFQQEIRKFLLLIGQQEFIEKTKRRFLFWKFHIATFLQFDISELMRSVAKLSANRIGALIIITRKNQLDDIIHTGIEIDAKLNASLIENIFWKNTPLHDGAMVVVHNKIKAVKCILPLSESSALPDGAGLRHRAALGISEISDAFAIIISEQSGEISIASKGELQKNISIDTLKEYLEIEFIKNNSSD